MLRTSKFSFATALVVVVLLIVCKVKVPFDILIADRFIGSWGGWLQILLAGVLGWFLYPLLLGGGGRVRIFLWLTFSVVFFLQLLLGLVVNERFLMTGALHFPVPMVIEGGFFYRLQLGFMPILFLVTVLLSGGGWCSHLCYFGSWDGAVAGLRKKQRTVNHKVRLAIRWTIFGLVAMVSFLLGRMEVSLLTVVILMSLWIGVSLFIIFFVTPYFGQMMHCTMFCPMGALVSVAKFLNPVRLSIDNDSCTRCNKCAKVCRYGALRREDIESGRMNINCTLCGDCHKVCNHSAVRYRCFGRSEQGRTEVVRRWYYVVLCALWVIFVMTARI